MDFHDVPWIAMDFHDFPWISMDFHGNPWIFMDFYGLPWISMAMAMATAAGRGGRGGHRETCFGEISAGWRSRELGLKLPPHL